MNFASRWILMKELQDRARRPFSITREDPELELPDAVLPEQERHAAVEREAERREHEES